MTKTERQLVIVAVVALGVLLVLPVLFMGGSMMGFGPMMGGMWGTGMAAGGSVPGWLPLFGAVTQLLFLAVLLGGGYLAYRALAGTTDTDRALEELRVAYARGEMSDEEYERRRSTLQRDR